MALLSFPACNDHFTLFNYTTGGPVLAQSPLGRFPLESRFKRPCTYYDQKVLHQHIFLYLLVLLAQVLCDMVFSRSKKNRFRQEHVHRISVISKATFKVGIGSHL